MNALVKVKNLSATLELPKYGTEGADGMDLMACFDAYLDGEKINPVMYIDYEKATLNASVGDIVTLYPGDRVMIPTGIAVEIPEGYRMHVTPRSGLALKNGITVLNTPGKIDSDYRGQLGVILINHGAAPFNIRHGDRIAQLAIESSIKCVWKQVDSLTDSTRGVGGFGSTGVSK